MQGKTTFILTDKDTGRVVEKREEHNMVTNAIRDIFAMPRAGMISSSSFSKGIAQYLPMYKHLLHGLILFGENIPESKDDYLINGRYSKIATAGDAYTGTDAMRGTFNTSQSGVIENGYRFVWDFAPEKAIGTIKCAALSSIHSGNQGGIFQGYAGGILSNPVDITNSGSEYMSIINGSPLGVYMMNTDKSAYIYYYYNSSTGVQFNKYRMTDPDAIGICSTKNLKLESSIANIFPTYFYTTSFNSYDRKVYFYDIYNSGGKTWVGIKAADAETGEYGAVTTSDINTQFDGSYYYQTKFAVFSNKLYAIYNGRMRIYNLDGTFVKEIPIALSDVYAIFVSGGKLWVNGTYSATGTPCYVIVGDSLTYLPNLSNYSNFCLTDNELINAPYVAVRNGANSYIMLRNDYLATINNLSQPLEKTDRHALQVRYEITN